MEASEICLQNGKLVAYAYSDVAGVCFETMELRAVYTGDWCASHIPIMHEGILYTPSKYLIGAAKADLQDLVDVIHRRNTSKQAKQPKTAYTLHIKDRGSLLIVFLDGQPYFDIYSLVKIGARIKAVTPITVYTNSAFRPDHDVVALSDLEIEGQEDLLDAIERCLEKLP